MSMTLDASQLPKYATNLGYEVMADAYQPELAIYPRLGRVIPVSAMSDAPYGHKAVGLVGAGTPTRRRDGQKVSAQSMGEGYPWQLACEEYADEIGIPDALLEAADAQRRVTSLITEFVTTYSRNAMVQKETFVAGMFQKGTIAAGSTTYFDNGYPGNPDANAGKIYDGKPWFAASSNEHPFKQYTPTGSEGVNLNVSLALDATGLDAAFRAINVTNALDERGKRIALTPRKLLVPAILRTTALQLLNSELLPGAANNDINANRGLVEPIISPYLTDDASAASTAAWWLGTDDFGLTIVDSGAPVLTTYRDDSTKTTMVQLSYRFGAAVHDWRMAFAANKATS
jgi:hypothetical protein